jgi:glycine/D-amino acid oxidase-like deaminating enzyme
LSDGVTVIGAGIVGASVAYHLARLGVPVTLIDRAAAPATGVTRDSFAWIGDSDGDWPGGADDLRGYALADYRRLEAEVPGVTVRWTGSLTWSSGAVAGRGQTWVGRDEIAALEPRLAKVRDRAVGDRALGDRAVVDRAVHSPRDGAVDPVGVTEALVEAARGLGARVVMDAGPVDLTKPTVVLAAGVGTAALADRLGVRLPLTGSPAMLLRVATEPGLIRGIVVTPDFEARELRPGHLLMTAPRPGGAALAEATVAALRETFPSDTPSELLGWAIGERPMPANGPIIGFLTPDRSAYVAVTHSAVNLAPTIGRLVAEELTTGRPVDELRRCRPS